MTSMANVMKVSALSTAFFLAGCGSVQNTAAAAPSPSPSVASASPRDPACGNTGLRTFLGEVQEEHERGAFDLARKVKITSKHTGGWVVALGGAKAEAGLQLYKTLESLDQAIKDNFVGSSDPLVWQTQALTIKIGAATVLLECGLSDDYTFDD